MIPLRTTKVNCVFQIDTASYSTKWCEVQISVGWRWKPIWGEILFRLYQQLDRTSCLDSTCQSSLWFCIYTWWDYPLSHKTRWVIVNALHGSIKCSHHIHFFFRKFSKISEYLNMVPIFGFSMENTSKWVQTCLCLVQWFLR